VTAAVALPHWTLRHCATCGEPINLRSDMKLGSGCDRCWPTHEWVGWVRHNCENCQAPFYAPRFDGTELHCAVCAHITKENPMTTVETATTTESNGVPHTEKRTRARRTSQAPAYSTIAAQLKDARDAAIAHRIALRHELAELDQMIGDEIECAISDDCEAHVTHTPKPRATRPARVIDDMGATVTAKSTPKTVRGPRKEGLPAKVLAYIGGKPDGASAEMVSTHLEIKPAIAHGALHSLLKQGKVTSAGERKARVWSIAT
jgi:hypothetical protein